MEKRVRFPLALPFFHKPTSVLLTLFPPFLASLHTGL
jgi:hypothetical protein